MKISDLLYQAKTGQLQVPQFQRGWVWKRTQVLQFFKSLYNDYPVGTLITWPSRIGNQPTENVIDGQQRLTTLYSLINGELPPWFRGTTNNSLKNLMFNVETQEFRFQTREMPDDPLWVDIIDLFREDQEWWAERYKEASGKEPQSSYHVRIAKLLSIAKRDLHVERLPDNVPTDEAAEVFRIVNRAGTRVSEGDLILGQLCIKWPEARERVDILLDQWRNIGYTISLEWLLHTISASLNGKINFEILLESDKKDIIAAFEKVRKGTSEILDHLRDILGLDRTTSTAINNGLIVAVINRIAKGASQNRAMIGWWLLSTLNNRWTADIRNRTNKDLETTTIGQGISGLLQEIRITNPSLEVFPNWFTLTRSSKPYYRLLLTLTRRQGARDLKSGLSLSFDRTSELSQLEAHHIFPRRLLTDAGLNRSDMDQLANLAFITKGANLRIGSRPPIEYLPEIEESNPGVLTSQWIPPNPDLWTIDSYPEFIEERSMLLADTANEFLRDLIGEYW